MWGLLLCLEVSLLRWLVVSEEVFDFAELNTKRNYVKIVAITFIQALTERNYGLVKEITRLTMDFLAGAVSKDRESACPFGGICRRWLLYISRKLSKFVK